MECDVGEGGGSRGAQRGVEVTGLRRASVRGSGVNSLVVVRHYRRRAINIPQRNIKWAAQPISPGLHTTVHPTGPLVGSFALALAKWNPANKLDTFMWDTLHL